MAPLVVLVMVTFCVDVKVPPLGEKVGVTTFIVYIASCVFEAGIPSAHALALSVVVCVMAMAAPDAIVESLIVGSAPLVV